MTYNQVYGKYSLGGGFNDKVFADINDPMMLKDYVKSLQYDCKRLGISLKDKTVVDVGTGRQAIAALKLGAKKVYHYDISEQNCKNLSNYIKKHKSPISTKQVDLVNYVPHQADFIYLHGIVQHFSHTGKGLKNCLEAIKKGGYVWLYFFRSGTFKNFVRSILRDLVGKKKNIDEYFLNSTILYSDTGKPNLLVSGLMDNLFVDYIYLYKPNSYIKFLKQAGFEIVFTSKLRPNVSVNHALYESVILGARRVSQGSPDISLLSPEKSINQLTIKDKHIMETVKEYYKLKKSLKYKNKMNFALSLYLIMKKMDVKKVVKNHKQLQMIF